ncbi:Hypothetical predicted protein [Pelobates cultripes]|uniref:Uncharacterized protein n=1 Tax=Pelobates cultripes TaxID=61616 RepID=A0AAD1W1Y7_PELCU|nr:Hypothetical predicted protein [Pelobates cultripes]
MEAELKSSSPQKPGVKGRSKSTEEIQPAKKAFHTTQKSLPSTGEVTHDQESKDAIGDLSSKEQKAEDPHPH